MNNSNGHVQRLTIPSRQTIGALTQHGQRVQIISPKKNVNPIPNELLDVVKIEEPDPLQPNTAYETGHKADETPAKDDNFDEQR